MTDDARDCEAIHIGRDRVSTVVVLRDGQHTSAACVGAPLGMAMAREALAQRTPRGQGLVYPPVDTRGQGAVTARASGSQPSPSLPVPDECKVGGPHYFEKIDPRDEKQLGMSGWHCVECGKARGD